MAKGSRPRVQREKRFHFQPFPEYKTSKGFQKRVSTCSAVDNFFFLSGWRRDFFIFLDNESMEDRGETHDPKSAIRNQAGPHWMSAAA
jgi:hypothetical protein